MVETKVVVVEVDGPTNAKTENDIAEENALLEKELRETRVHRIKDLVKEKNELRAKEKEMAVTMVSQQDRSVNLGVVGVGQCGSKIAEEFYNRGYNTVVINTAVQDLKPIQIPERQKLFLDYALGGAAKDLDTGREAAEQFSEEITKHIADHTENCEILMLVTSGGGGTGAGSAETVVKIMAGFGKPISVLFVLPMSSEDSLAKHNAVQTLAQLAQLAQKDVINSLIVVDNSKIELMFPGKSMAEFWKVANSAIVEPLHLFNQLSATSSAYTSLDPMDFSRLFVGTGDCALYGMIEVENYMEDSAIAEAMVTNLNSGLLSGDFDLTQTRSAGVIVTGSPEVLSKVPAANIEYGFAMVSKICNDSLRIFRGTYSVPGDDKIRIYSFFSGLGLPEAKVTELKAEADRHMAALQNKESTRASSMNIDVGKTKTTSAADATYNKIMAKNSAMGKLKFGSKGVVDKRRK